MSHRIIKPGLLLLVLLFAISQLTGCIGSPRYARYSDAQGSKTAGLTDPVEYQIDLKAGQRYPDCVAILPLAVAKEAAEPVELPRAGMGDSASDGVEEPSAYQRHLESADKQRLVRQMLYGFVSSHSPRDIELARIDRVLKQTPPNSRATQKRLGQQLSCDWLLQGKITQFDVDYLGLYSNIRIGVELTLVRASTGHVLWSGRHLAQSRDGAVPLSPIGLAMGAVKAASNLEPDQLEGVAADLARRLVRTMPLEQDNVFLVAAIRATQRIYEVVAKRLNLRSGPGVHYEVRGVLQDNQQVSILDSPARGWCKVRTPDGQTGFVAMRYLRVLTSSRDS